MSIVDESHLSQRAEETTFYHAENITFSKNFRENLIQASDDLLNRCLNEDAQFLAELGATLSENYHHNGQEESLAKCPTNLRERLRIIQARTNIYNFQCSQVQLCLKESTCNSEEADYLRFLAEYRQLARNLPENWTEQTASEVGIITTQAGFGPLRLKLEQKVLSGNADAFTVYLLGLAYKAVGDLDKAKQTFIKAITLYSYLWGSFN
ncbi:Oidioi.mRNA.OKI2018_I69.PAR.g10517.t1.cds [Oikopleura dioica]|uniref:Oidioi.mRNA.OKI2018_I69.PAR.g10517.t1.cds n=1 Tax=Oikopleura dioica TaxID=34765 RepID=A0ABN7RW84_OIKDI|nr:Oidioi.mRNA.OKI2018_I69.PAR.g10517.t1.cds [Oikopleura dioica]